MLPQLHRTSKASQLKADLSIMCTLSGCASSGVDRMQIRLLARQFYDRSIGWHLVGGGRPLSAAHMCMGVVPSFIGQ
jgi:hypothetical protein